MSTIKTRTPRLVISFIVVLVAVVLALSFCFYGQAAGQFTFDADTVARAELRMWKAYYTDNKLQIGLEFTQLLQSSYNLPFPDAAQCASDFASAAMKFRAARGNYEAIALPDLRKAYTRIKKISGKDFDIEKVSRAELGWWVARRTRGKNTPKQVGAIIARLYSLIYGAEHPAFKKAGLLRAQAARLRDIGGKNADWSEIEKLLLKSYRALALGIANQPGNQPEDNAKNTTPKRERAQ